MRYGAAADAAARYRCSVRSDCPADAGCWRAARPLRERLLASRRRRRRAKRDPEQTQRGSPFTPLRCGSGVGGGRHVGGQTARARLFSSRSVDRIIIQRLCERPHTSRQHTAACSFRLCVSGFLSLRPTPARLAVLLPLEPLRLAILDTTAARQIAGALEREHAAYVSASRGGEGMSWSLVVVASARSTDPTAARVDFWRLGQSPRFIKLVAR